MEPKVIYSSGGDGGCAGGTCPTIYQIENGNFLIQGYNVDGPSLIKNLPSGESVVELPKEFLEGFISALKEKGGV